MHLRCDFHFIADLLLSPMVTKIKIGQHVAKLWARVMSFLIDGVASQPLESRPLRQSISLIGNYCRVT